ncbi:MAG TPA: cadmium-translocating P-type ATPase [Clostridiaceae bacterium]|nr:cadmium-translocating P-type ATPase [Clostridiaceae bacterium]
MGQHHRSKENERAYDTHTEKHEHETHPEYLEKSQQTDQADDHEHMNHDTHGGHNSHDHKGHHAIMVADFRRRFFFSLILMVPILALSPMIQMFLGINWRFSGDLYILFGLSTILFFYGGWPFIKGSIDELAEKSPAMMTLITLAIVVAYVYSSLTLFAFEGSDFFWELATLIVVMLLGHWIEMRSVIGASRALDELIKLMPEEAHVIGENGETVDRPVSSLEKGDRILVKPGEKIPIDGEIFEGRSSVNEAMITGESNPVDKAPGDPIIGGSINGEGVLKFDVNKTGDETFISQVIKLVREAQQSKSKTQRLADVAAKWLFYIAISAGTITFIIWMISNGDPGFAMERAVTVVIISCPHALGLAIPLVTAMSTGIGAKQGLLIRSRAAFENARKIDTVIFDKTGTLTEGQFGVMDITAIGISENELLEIAYALESNSEHPIAQGIVKEGKKRGIELKPATDYQNLTGQGLKAKVDGQEFFIGSPGFMRSQKISIDEALLEKSSAEGKTVIYILSEQTLLGFIALSDIIRDSSRPAIDALRTMGIESYLVTGDNQRAAAHVANQLGIEHVFAEVLPDEKAIKVDDIQKSGKKVAMTGDGVNDAPALAKADLGIAIGAGTDVAIETADVVLVKSNPQDVVSLIRLSRATYRKMIQNLIWATAYNVVALPLAAGILYNQGVVITPALGAVLMSMSTIIVAINARLIRN